METPQMDSFPTNRYENILRLITLWQDYERQSGTEARLEDFGAWMHEQMQQGSREYVSGAGFAPSALFPPSPASKNQIPFPNVDAMAHLRMDADGMISILLGRMGRYSKMYIKKAFEGQRITSIDEFALMAAIMRHQQSQGEPTKSDVYSATLTEVTTGAEIMRRLEKAGFLEEYSDTKDKRMRRVRMTASGKGAFFQAAQQMGAASHIVAGTLTDAQKQDLIRLLTQLDAFHHTMYAEHRMESFAEMDSYAAEERTRKANISAVAQERKRMSV